NSEKPLDLLQLRGSVVVIYVFQMLCPACVSHSLPQAKKLHQYFSAKDISILGLHSVFEHHPAMNNIAREAFISEYRLGFPIAVDTPSESGPAPQTMQRYQLQGTPSLLIIDQQGYLRVKAFGAVDDLVQGHWLGNLLGSAPEITQKTRANNTLQTCTSDG